MTTQLKNIIIFKKIFLFHLICAIMIQNTIICGFGKEYTNDK